MAPARPDRGRATDAPPHAWRLLLGQVRYQVRILVRSPIASFATLVIPLMVLLAVNLLYDGTRLPTRGGIRFAQFFTPAMIAFAVVNACYMSIVSSTVLAREDGILRRIRSTPLPRWVYMAGRIIAAGLVSLASTTVVILLGAELYGFQMIWTSVPVLLADVTVAIFCFCALGFAVSVLVPRADSALPICWGTILPLCFISDVFQPIDTAPRWLRLIASSFPLRPFADDLEAAFNPVATRHGLSLVHLGVMTVWGIGAALFAVAAFRWQPSSTDTMPARLRHHMSRALAALPHRRHPGPRRLPVPAGAGRRGGRDRPLPPPVLVASDPESTELIEGPAPAEDSSLPGNPVP